MALVPVIAYLIFANPAVFKMTRKIAGGWIASPDGLPTMMGLFLHALIFVIFVSFVMNKKSKFLAEVVDGQYTKFQTREDQDDQNTRHFEENRLVI
jgi:hypothetical protein